MDSSVRIPFQNSPAELISLGSALRTLLADIHGVNGAA